MTDQWYYVHDSKRIGPLTARQLMERASAGQLKPTDMVWKEGMEKGIPAEKVKNLFPHARSGGDRAQSHPTDSAGTSPASTASWPSIAVSGAPSPVASPLTLSFSERVDSTSVELPPDLPAPAFYCTESWHAERIGALALYCSDGRWGEAFDEFCHRHLQIPRYDRLAVAGGPAWLGKEDAGSHLMQAARTQLDFLVRVHELEEIVLITHYGCAFYAERLHANPRECLPSQMEDVRTAAGRLRGWYAGLRIEGYLAMRTGQCLAFHKLDV